MNILIYTWIHIISIVLLVIGFSSLINAKSAKEECVAGLRKMGAIFQGIGLLGLLVSGFGMMARLNLKMAESGWVHPKLLIWLLLGVGIVALKRGWLPSKVAYAILTLLIAIAAYLGIFKPF